MGTLVYGPAASRFEFDDRTLAHLRVAILSKFRRQESFALSFAREVSGGHGRETLWLHPTIPLQFTFFDDTMAEPLNRQWVTALGSSANNGEMRVVAEPEPVGEPVAAAVR